MAASRLRGASRRALGRRDQVTAAEPKRCRGFVAREAVFSGLTKFRLRTQPSRPSARAEPRAAPDRSSPSPVGQANPDVYLLARRPRKVEGRDDPALETRLGQRRLYATAPHFYTYQRMLVHPDLGQELKPGVSPLRSNGAPPPLNLLELNHIDFNRGQRAPRPNTLIVRHSLTLPFSSTT